MKSIILIIIATLIVFVAYKYFRKPIYAETTSTIGDIANIEDLIEKLMISTNDTAFLRIQIHGTDDFIQFTGGPDGVQLDLPLFNDRQKSLESRFRGVGMDLELNVYETKGSDGSRFLDADINGNASEITTIVKKFVGELFSVTSSTKLVFEYSI
jgi:hypothetical protein